MAERGKRKRSKSKKLLKQFSTLSEGTLHSPSLSLCLELVSKLYHRHILLRDGVHESRRDMEWEDKFDIDNFLAKRYNTYMTYPLIHMGGPYIFKQQRKRSKIKLPSFETINQFLIGIFKKLHLNVESSIVSLIYTERLMDKRHISVTLRNWRPILLASILTASKVWDDLSSWNIEFSNLLPVLSLQAINKLEGLYLQALQYDLYISSSEYARYYFALRGLKNTKTEHIPRYYLDMKIFKKNTYKNHNKPNKISIDLNQSLSRRAKKYEKNSIMNHAENLKIEISETHDENSIMEEAKYPPCDNDNQDNNLTHSMVSVSQLTNDGLTSSSESNKSNNSSGNYSNKSVTNDVIKEEEEIDQFKDNNVNKQLNDINDIIPRSKGIILKPKQKNDKIKQEPSYSMPSKLHAIRPING
eukprot:96079_1